MKIQRFSEGKGYDSYIDFVHKNLSKTKYELCTYDGSGKIKSWLERKSLDECLDMFEKIFLETNDYKLTVDDGNEEDNSDDSYVFILKTTSEVLEEPLELRANSKKYNL